MTPLAILTALGLGIGAGAIVGMLAGIVVLYVAERRKAR